MAWGGKLWSPIAIKAPVKVERRVVPVKVSENTVRYESRRIEPNFFEPIYPSYNSMTRKEKKKKRRWDRYWDDEDAEDSIVDSKPAYSFSTSRWTNYNFSSFVYDSEDNNNLFVREPENYMTPTSDQIKAKSNFYYSEDMVRIKELARVCYFKMIDEKDYIAEKYKEPGSCGSWEKKKAMCDNVYDTYVPGYTPLEQAIAINYTIRDLEAKNRKHKTNDRKSSRFEFKRTDYADPNINEQLELNSLSRKHKMDILNKISIIGDMGNQFKVERQTGEVEVANSFDFRKRLMRSHEQLALVDLYQRLLPNYKERFYTKNLIVNVPVQTSEKKQKIIMLCDYSGSMNEDGKQIWVNALLIDRFRYVMRGEAEIFFSFFVSSKKGLHFTHIKNAKDVREFWKHHSNYPSGGQTDIGGIVTHVAEAVASGTFFKTGVDLSKERPEILIINDGQDVVDYDELPYKVNAISLMDFSDELKNLCVATGGKQIQITDSNEIYAYSDEGKTVIAE